jgi:multiple sugar transport system substrate-binding protein
VPEFPSLNRRSFFTAAGAVSLGAMLGGCGSTAAPAATAPVGQADIDQEIALFQRKYPAIKVNAVNSGRGTPEYTKLRTALQAGTGAPDAVQIEYQYIPTFTISDSLLDLRPYGAEALRDRFVDWTWGDWQTGLATGAVKE